MKQNELQVAVDAGARRHRDDRERQGQAQVDRRGIQRIDRIGQIIEDRPRFPWLLK